MKKNMLVFAMLSMLIGVPALANFVFPAGNKVAVMYTDTWQFVRDLEDTTASTTMEPMPYTEVNITLLAPCDLRITFSGSMKLYYQIPMEEESHTESFEERALYIGARIFTLPNWLAYPANVIALQRSSNDELDTGYHAVSFTFVRDGVPAGTYTIKIYWRVSTLWYIGHVTHRSLVVTANGAGHY